VPRGNHAGPLRTSGYTGGIDPKRTVAKASYTDFRWPFHDDEPGALGEGEEVVFTVRFVKVSRIAELQAATGLIKFSVLKKPCNGRSLE
jgi:hypothetical protein